MHLSKTGTGRDIAVDALYLCCEKGMKSDEAFEKAFLKAFGHRGAAPRKEIALAKRLFLGTLSRIPTIDYFLGKLLSKPLSKQNTMALLILRLSIYELLFMDSIPPYSTLSEAGRMADDFGIGGLKGMINAVLRNFLSASEEGRVSIETLPDEFRYATPPWILELIKNEAGERYHDVLEASLSVRPVSVRFNLSKASEEDIRSLLTAEGIHAEPVDMETILSENGCMKPEGPLPVIYEVISGDIFSSKAFRKGLIAVQDPAAALALSFAAPHKNDFILDLAAAPGGKTFAAADILDGTGVIYAIDLRKKKIPLIENDMRRQGFRNIVSFAMDARDLPENFREKADIVIADLPCSGLGVLGGRPDIKLRLRPGDIDSLAKLQKDILCAVEKYVKPGGRILYSTCTLSGKENEANVSFLLRHFSLRLLSKAKLLPGAHNDGFFITCMEKFSDG